MTAQERIDDTIGEGLAHRNYLPGQPIDKLLSLTYFEDGNFFHTVDGRMVKVWRVWGVDRSLLMADETESVSLALQAVLSHYPHRASGQFIHHRRANAWRFISRFENGLRSDLQPAEELFAQSVVRRQMEAAVSPHGHFPPVEPRKDLLEREESRDSEAITTRKEALQELSASSGSGKFPVLIDNYLVFYWTPEFISKGLLSRLSDKALSVWSSEKALAVAQRAYEKDVEVFNQLASNIEQQLEASNFSAQIVKGQGVIDHYFDVLNPQRATTDAPPPFTGNGSIREFLSSGDFSGDNSSVRCQPGYSPVVCNDAGWSVLGFGDRGDYHMMVTSLKQRPEQTMPGMLQMALNGVEGDYTIAVNFHVTSPGVRERRLWAKEWSLGIAEKLASAEFPIGIDTKSIEKQRQELEHVRHVTNSENPSSRQLFLDTSIHVITGGYDRDEVLSRAEQVEKKLWNFGILERRRGDAYVHGSILGNYHAEQREFLKRDTPFLSSTVADMLPIYSEFPGTSTKGVLLNNRSGQPVCLDPFDPTISTTGHSLFVGGTGSGKSVGVNYFIDSLNTVYKSKTFILDKGYSYQSECLSRGGNYIYLVTEPTYNQALGREVEPTCFNPFFTELDDDGVTRVRPDQKTLYFQTRLLLRMLATGQDTTAIEVKGIDQLIPYLYSQLESFYDSFLAEHPGREATMSDFMRWLNQAEEEDGISGASIARRLRLFYGSGPFAGIFDGELGIDWDNDITVLETEAMADSPALATVVLAFFHQVDQYSKYRLERKVRKTVIVDEAWAVLSDPIASAALTAFFREFRRYGGACWLISQALTDFTNIVDAQGKADDGIWVNISHLVLFAAGTTDHQALAELELPQGFIEEWKSVRSVRPYFSEFMYACKHTSNRWFGGACRLQATPEFLWSATSDSVEFGIRENLVGEYASKGMDESDARMSAIAHLSKKYPYGYNYVPK